MDKINILITAAGGAQNCMKRILCRYAAQMAFAYAHISIKPSGGLAEDQYYKAPVSEEIC